MWMTPRSTNQSSAIVERRQLLDRETTFGVIGVQEVEGVLEVDVVSVAPMTVVGVCVFMTITTLYLLTGYAQEGTLDQ